MEQRIRSFIEPEQSLPAVGQGAIGIECRLDDQYLIKLLEPLNHRATYDKVMCERAMNLTLEGGCQVPIGSYSVLQGEELWLRALVGEPDGSKIIRGEIRGSRNEAEALGVTLANQLLDNGARDILTNYTRSRANAMAVLITRPGEQGTLPTTEYSRYQRFLLPLLKMHRQGLL